MALKDRLRIRLPKRFGNVDRTTSDVMNFSSSDSESEALDSKNKVRKGFSTRRLMKESECFTVDNDHIYTSARPSETVYDSIRKRKISEESDEKPPKKRCFSKNAVMARQNRERKKQYVKSLETENESLRKENSEIHRKVEEQNQKISVMRREILYLKGLLANSKELEQILRNLKDVTGLPVTSSVISSTKRGSPNIKEEPDTTEVEQKSNVVAEYHPRIKTVNSGRNFPILDKDINLGSCSDNSFNDMADLENSPFHFENDFYDISPQNLNNDDDFFSFDSNCLDLEPEEYFKLDEITKTDELQAGICLHVNQKRISVEICSICNSKATSLGDSITGEVF